ncbi:glycosyltransferase family 2 protein [Sapientia aquatica]|uniref:Glycosyltransferase family 2 protein n=1 Tax=Sapientia aquatica TaxID=1549640 RepID=A0A4R5W4E1_9BURK|nr:glycosyltransferase family A protein [Sapientia aquatica]TDK67551.1 glycosyltransferase family 2 protein [Sapientia aquatica]
MPEITIVCVAYKRYHLIPILIHCFLAQTLQNFKLLVLHDGYDEQMHTLLDEFKVKHPDKFDYYFSEQRFNDYGHTLRDIGIKMAESEYILITNDDNYYCPDFLEIMFKAIKQTNASIAMCDMVHGHTNPGNRPQLAHTFFETFPQINSVDIGCFITKTSYAKQVGFRDKGYAGDATYFEDILRVASDGVYVKVPQILFYHN